MTKYNGTSVALHWIIALAIVISFSVGLYMADLPFSPNKLKLYSWHKWAGVTIFLFVVLRLVWRMTHAAPPLPVNMPGWQISAAKLSHVMLYVLMFAIPITGWLMSSAKGFQTVYFGVLPIPDLLIKNRETGELLEAVHRNLNYFMAFIVAGHVAAAFKHHFIDRDDILRRMLPGKSVTHS
jgi:cytochrome b561